MCLRVFLHDVLTKNQHHKKWILNFEGGFVLDTLRPSRMVLGEQLPSQKKKEKEKREQHFALSGERGI